VRTSANAAVSPDMPHTAIQNASNHVLAITAASSTVDEIMRRSASIQCYKA
jgi:hypothetical protein